MSDTSALDRLVVVLVRPRNPLNIGAAARAMSNFGFRHLRTVNPYARAWREARSAIGAADLLANAEEHETVADAVRDCVLVVGTTAVRTRVLKHELRKLDQDGGSLIRDQLSARAPGGSAANHVALLFGSEKVGLSTEDLSHCQWLLHVATQKDHISMNLGQAVAVCLYEIARSGDGEKRSEKVDRPAAEELELIGSTLLETLHMSGYVKPGSSAATEEKVRRMIRRMDLRSVDAKVWLGMLRQIQWKLGK